MNSKKRSKKPSGKTLWNVLRNKCRSDFLFLVEHVLWPFDFGNVKMLDWHKARCVEIGKGIDDNVPKTLDLWFRGGFKSTFVSRYSTIYRFLRNPDITQLLRHGDAGKAMGILMKVKLHLTNNRKFREIFPEYCPARGKQFGTQDEFNLPCRSMITAEPSLRAVGIESNITGDHYMHIHDDDIENETNVGTSDTRRKLILKWEDTPSLLTKPPIYRGTHSMVGTPWHSEGLWDHVIKKFGPGTEAHTTGQMLFRFYPACELDRTPLVPEIMPKDEIERIYLDQGPTRFAANYMLRPSDPDTAVFKEEWIRRMPYPEDWKPDDRNWLGQDVAFRRFLTIDLAESQKRDADYLAYLVVDIDQSGKWYYHECFEQRMDTYTFIQRIQDLHEKWRFDRVYVDAVASQNYFSKWLKRENELNDVSMPVHPVKKIEGQKSKYQRILACQARWSRGDCYLMEGAPFSGIFIHNLMNYPAVGHDDLLDAMAQLEMMEPKANKQIAPKSPPPGSLAFFQNMHDETESKRSSQIGNWWKNPRKRSAIITVRRKYG